MPVLLLQATCSKNFRQRSCPDRNFLLKDAWLTLQKKVFSIRCVRPSNFSRESGAKALSPHLPLLLIWGAAYPIRGSRRAGRQLPLDTTKKRRPQSQEESRDLSILSWERVPFTWMLNLLLFAWENAANMNEEIILSLVERLSLRYCLWRLNLPFFFLYCSKELPASEVTKQQASKISLAMAFFKSPILV